MVEQPFLYLTRNTQQKNLIPLCTDMKTIEQAAMHPRCISHAESGALEAFVLMTLPPQKQQS